MNKQSESKEDFYRLYMGYQNYGILTRIDLLGLIKEHITYEEPGEPIEIIITKVMMTRQQFKELPEI